MNKGKERGITLIALIITIIIMLILAAVTVSVAVDGNLFGKAEEAADKTNRKVGELQKDIDHYTGKLNELDTNTNTTEYNDGRIAILEDWISLIQTAEGGMTEIHSLIYSLNELTLQLANETNTEADKNNIINEIEALLEEITRVATTITFNEQKLLDGTFSGRVSVDNTTISIENCSAEALGLTSNELRATLLTNSGATEYLKKIETAINFFSDNRAMLGGNQHKFDYLIRFYKEKANIITTYKIDVEKRLAKKELEIIKQLLERNKELMVMGSNGTCTDIERKNYQIEIKLNIEAINAIIKEEYNGTTLLDGNHCGISKIDLNTLGIANHLSITELTVDDAARMANEYTSAIQIVNNEISKLN